MAEQEKLNILIDGFGKLEENRKNYICELTQKLADIHNGGEIKDAGKSPKESGVKMRFIAPLIIALLFSGNFMSCVTAPEKTEITVGEASPLVSGSRWEYSEGDSSSFIYYVDLNEDGSAVWYDKENKIIPHMTVESTWMRQGDTVSILHNSRYRLIEGKLVTENGRKKIAGAGKNSHRREWNFTMLEN